MPTLIPNLFFAQTPISAGQARKRFGELLDKTFYQGKSFLIERAGRSMVAMVPVSEYQEMQRVKAEARARFFATTDDIRYQVAQSELSAEAIQSLIEEAVGEVRNMRTQPSTDDV